MSLPVDALLVVDVQRALVEGDRAVVGATELLGRLAVTVERARGGGLPVVFLQDNGAHGDLIRRDSPGWELALPVRAGETVIAKDEDDGFVGTALEEVLRTRGVERLAVVGVQSEMCVAATVRGALSRGFEVVLPRDGHTTFDVPDGGPGAPAVPAALVSRVAEWSLGDGVELPASVGDLTFDRRTGG